MGRGDWLERTLVGVYLRMYVCVRTQHLHGLMKSSSDQDTQMLLSTKLPNDLTRRSLPTDSNIRVLQEVASYVYNVFAVDTSIVVVASTLPHYCSQLFNHCLSLWSRETS